ncbi:MAG: TetR/AcrR family transcriptional regulator [Lachnospiraceae bacterium]|nr:TetR/AcrR family transcriptional regulator [Lachnospiraceae bacterium]
MPKVFSEDMKDNLRIKLLDLGFEMLKNGGLSAVNLDELTQKTFIAKGTFYNLFKNKSEYMYYMMLHERKRSKTILSSYLDEEGKLDKDNLKNYLLWLSEENPNIFSYLTDAEQKRLIASWDIGYIENEDNDSDTMHMLISILKAPRENPDWKLACNYMKLIALSLSMKNVFITDNYDEMINSLIEQIVDLLSY